ncbi:hypothetical protein SAMN05216466_101202 [Paraburkholderia phenazinium]|uniref:Uncharacterized protein n=1 Tax=Paraburkholderia phenazinium TaxID=60549 RepID=A0A1G7P9I2_9BURK|nr:hypothetical protein SAMN05216466_101202 [Paraburkholderia phenazinium]
MMSGRSDKELGTFFDQAMRFVKHYAFGYQLEGPIYLLLDNSSI